MGFIRDIRRVLALLPGKRQNLLFSATFSDDIRSLADGILHQPATVQVTPRNTATALVTQLVIPVDRERKRELLSSLIRSGRIEQALVFTRTKHGANRLAEQLARDGIAAAAIHGNKSQGQRVRALDDFKAGRATILVATEVASRGLDIEQLPHVVNYELPMVAEDYVHRIGRTGRAGATGDAVSLVCVDEAPLLREIERLLGRPIPTEVIRGFEPDRSIRPEPIRQRSQGGGRSAMGSRPGANRGSRAGIGSAPRPAVAAGPRRGSSTGQRPVGTAPGTSVGAGPRAGRPQPTHHRRDGGRGPHASAPQWRPAGPGPRPTQMPGERIARSGVRD
jgi:ATP-dependent RNA helicase RhlE